ncbi:MAG: hypothetical protein KDE08_08785 [Rhodobacteraceae bacterium]|nr:hypothetical protein [Paracoccaceae bacterium]
MKSLLVAGALGALLSVGSALAGPIDQACIRANRTASAELCGCIQRVADMTLSGSDQKLAASFFADPARAQEVRQSDRQSLRAFWGRYMTFGSAAEDVCSG